MRDFAVIDWGCQPEIRERMEPVPGSVLACQERGGGGRCGGDSLARFVRLPVADQLLMPYLGLGAVVELACPVDLLGVDIIGLTEVLLAGAAGFRLG